MKSLQQSLMMVRDELNKIEGAKFFHYQRDPDTKKEYGVWMENGEGDAFHADNHKAEQQISGTLDYYTQIEYNPILDEIQEALDRIDPGGWTLESVQYEDETDLIHYEWTFTVR